MRYLKRNTLSPRLRLRQGLYALNLDLLVFFFFLGGGAVVGEYVLPSRIQFEQIGRGSYSS